MTCTCVFDENLILLWTGNRVTGKPIKKSSLTIRVIVANIGKRKLKGLKWKIRV